MTTDLHLMFKPRKVHLLSTMISVNSKRQPRYRPNRQRPGKSCCLSLGSQVAHTEHFSSVQPSLWPTATPSLVASPSSAATPFDPFESFAANTADLLQPVNSPPSSAANKAASNDLDFFMMPTQPTQQPSLFFPQQQQSAMRAPMFQQTPQQSMMFPLGQQQLNRPNNPSFNVSSPFVRTQGAV